MLLHTQVHKLCSTADPCPSPHPPPPPCSALGTPFLAPSRGLLLAGCVSLWALRLGGYLFYRVMNVGARRAAPRALCRLRSMEAGGGCGSTVRCRLHRPSHAGSPR